MKINQSSFDSTFVQYYRNPAFASTVEHAIRRIPFFDGSSEFRDLVNFGRSKSEAYQSWFRYREGYSRQLVRQLISRANLDPAKYFIADPMVGSGTTSLELCSVGIDALSLDINPISECLVKLKTLRPSESLMGEVCSIASRLDFHLHDTELSSKVPFKEYFSDGILERLMSIRTQICAVDNTEARMVLFGCWLMILEDCSNRKRDGNGLVTRPSKVADLETAFLDKLDKMLSDYRHHPLNSKSQVCHVVGSAKSLDVASSNFEFETGKQLGLVIFSPPYANSFDYVESYKLELVLGDFCTYSKLDELRNSAIRNYRVSKRSEDSSRFSFVEELASEIELAIPEKENSSGKIDSRSRLVPGMLRSYFEDMSDVLRSIFRSLVPGGQCLMIVDQSAYLGKLVPTDYLLALIAEEIGFKVDRITLCRKAMTSAQQLKQFPYLKDSLMESIVELTKS